MEFLRAHRWVRRSLSILSVVMLLAGLGFISYPFATDVWQGRVQKRLDNELASPEMQKAYRERKIATGDSLTRIRIPAIGVDFVVVYGTTRSALRAGAGHYVQTALPCESGNTAIAGHRTTFGRPFANVDRLKPGDVIELITPIGGCVYQVSQPPMVVAPTNLSVIEPTPVRSITLTTCHPKGSASERLIIRGTWVKDLKDVKA